MSALFAPLLKLYRATPLAKWRWQLVHAFQSLPVLLPNFLFQRIFRQNGDCPWSVHFTSRVLHPKRMQVHSSVLPYLAQSGGLYVQAINGLEIGEGTIIAPGVKIVSANHSLEDFSKWDPAPPLRIGKRCWLGANAVVLPGVELGDNVIVAAGSVVTKSFTQNTIVGGVPARILKQRQP